MGVYAEKVKKEHDAKRLTGEQIRSLKCQRTKARNAARKEENIKKMKKCTPRPWTLHKQTYTNYKAAKSVSDHFKKEGEETRIVCRPSGKFDVKHRETK